MPLERIIFRYGIDSQVNNTPGVVLDVAEAGFTTDNKTVWIGDGTTNPPRLMTTKSTGDFTYSSIGKVVFAGALQAASVNGVDLSLFNISNGFVTRTGDKTFAERTFISSNGSIVIGNPAGTSGNVDFTLNPTVLSNQIINTYNQNFAINEILNKTVYGANADFVDFPAAFAWLTQKTISTQGMVNLILPAGTITVNKRLNFTHPNGDRITIRGAPLKSALPAIGSLQRTGSSPAQRNSDIQANLIRMRASYSTELTFINGGGIDINGNLNIIKDILFTSDGLPSPGGTNVDGLVFANGFFTVQRIAAVGFNFRGISFSYGSSVTSVESFFSFWTWI